MNNIHITPKKMIKYTLLILGVTGLVITIVDEIKPNWKEQMRKESEK